MFSGVQPLIVEAYTSDALTYDGYLNYRKIDEDNGGTDDYIEIVESFVTKKEVIVPSEIDGLPIKVLGKYAFRESPVLTSVTIP